MHIWLGICHSPPGISWVVLAATSGVWFCNFLQVGRPDYPLVRNWRHSLYHSDSLSPSLPFRSPGKSCMLKENKTERWAVAVWHQTDCFAGLPLGVDGQEAACVATSENEAFHHHLDSGLRCIWEGVAATLCTVGTGELTGSLRHSTRCVLLGFLTLCPFFSCHGINHVLPAIEKKRQYL